MKKVNKTIAVCASASFYKDVIEIEKQLKKLGYKVKIPAVANRMKKSGNFKVEDYKIWFNDESAYKVKTKLIVDYFKKIVESDAILVVNQEKTRIPGYIGGNVLMEMTIAFHYKKPIYVWNNIDNKSPFEEEIKALNSIFLDRDLTKIK